MSERGIREIERIVVQYHEITGLSVRQALAEVREVLTRIECAYPGADVDGIESGKNNSILFSLTNDVVARLVDRDSSLLVWETLSSDMSGSA